MQNQELQGKKNPVIILKIVKLLGLNFNLNNAIKMKKLCLRLLAQFFL
jgi:hypothetical protein